MREFEVRKNGGKNEKENELTNKAKENETFLALNPQNYFSFSISLEISRKEKNETSFIRPSS